MARLGRHVQCRLVGCRADREEQQVFQGYLNSRDEAPSSEGTVTTFNSRSILSVWSK